MEKYAFITNENHALHVKSKWPDAISIGNNYRMVQFAGSDEPELIALAESLGFAVKRLSLADTILVMDNLNLGPFICTHEQAVGVVNYFNPPVDDID